MKMGFSSPSFKFVTTFFKQKEKKQKKIYLNCISPPPPPHPPTQLLLITLYIYFVENWGALKINNHFLKTHSHLQ